MQTLYSLLFFFEEIKTTWKYFKWFSYVFETVDSRAMGLCLGSGLPKLFSFGAVNEYEFVNLRFQQFNI